MNIIKKVFELIEYYANKYKITFAEGNKYYSWIKNIQFFAENFSENISLSVSERNGIISFLDFLEIPLVKENVFKIKNPNTELILGETNVDKYSINMLTDAELLAYLMFIFSTVTFNENDGMVLLKYNIIIWNSGFHKFAKIARGKIVDINTKEIISYPFDKFFNINENADTQDYVVRKHLTNNRYLYVLDKKDGSTIIVSKHNGKPLITTNGSFDNEQIDWAKDLFKKKYSKFLSNIKEGFTYIFELIHPENRIVVDYGDEEALYMLSIRNLKTENLLSIDEIHSVADEFGFPYPEVFSFNDLDDIVYLAHTMKNANREGWVLRIGAADGNEYMVKIKLDEYFELHSAFDKIKLSFVYRHLIDNDLDDFMSIANEEQKKKIDEKLSIIDDIRNKVKVEAISIANEYLDKHGLTLETYSDDREKMIVFINDVLSSKNVFKFFAVQYIKFPATIDDKIAKIKISHMKNYSKMFGYEYNE